MSAIPAASVSLKTMADGTLRMTFDIEPAQAKDAFSLFSSPGTPVAIAALKQGYEAKSPDPAATQKDPLGPLAKWLVLRCNEVEFWRFLEDEATEGRPVMNSQDAGEVVKHYLEIESRKEVDTDRFAETRCKTLIVYPYQKWLVRRGVPA